MSDQPDSLADGRYTLDRLLGRGGMASVYRGYDQRLSVWRAIKLLHPDYARRPRLRQRFEGEAKALAALEHPNIVRVYDVGVDRQWPYIVMELLEGGSAGGWLEEHGPLPPRYAARLTVQLCSGLAWAHGRAVVHRDVKPDNLLLAADGTAKVADFGIARLTDDEEVRHTRTGAVMGTLGFMAPEQQTDAKSVDERADIYAVGASLYNLLTGRTTPDLAHADQHPELFDDVDPDLAGVIRVACRRRAGDRYATATAMARELAALIPRLPAVPAGTPPLVPGLAEPREEPTAEPHRNLLAADGRPIRVVAAEARAASGPELPQVHPPTHTLAVANEPAWALTVQRECEPKRLIGRGRPLDGTIEIHRMLAIERAIPLLHEAARRVGAAPEAVRVRVDEDMNAVSWRDLAEARLPLDAHAKHCASCPANVRGRPYGCIAQLTLPVSAAVDPWLATHLQPAGSVGGELASGLASAGFDGRSISRLRREWLHGTAMGVVVKKGWLRNTTVTTDQVLQAIFDPGANSIDPTRALEIALWLGVVRIGARKGTELQQSDLVWLMRVPMADRQTATCDLGDVPPEAREIADVIHALFKGWQTGVRVLVEPGAL